MSILREQPSAKSAADITGMLAAWCGGDEQALDRLMPLVYDELRRLAAAYLRRERCDHSLQATALVHEAYLRLIDQANVRWKNRAHFFGLAAQMMRRILVDHARRQQCGKRRGQMVRLEEVPQVWCERAPELVALDDALTGLEAAAPELAEIVELRFFGGLTTEEMAQLTGISVATVRRRLRFARAWLGRFLTGTADSGAISPDEKGGRPRPSQGEVRDGR